MMMEYAGQGEVLKHLAKAGKFSEKRSSRVGLGRCLPLRLVYQAGGCWTRVST